jgi:hypothetical protein
MLAEERIAHGDDWRLHATLREIDDYERRVEEVTDRVRVEVSRRDVA